MPLVISSWNIYRPDDRVGYDCKNSVGSIYSFQSCTNDTINREPITGRACGNIICVNTLKWLAPSIKPASAYVQDSVEKNEYSTIKLKPNPAAFVTSRKGVSIMPSAV